LILPELGLGEVPIRASKWFRSPGQEVIQGDRLLEVLAGGATIELPSPLGGTLARRLVAEGEQVSVGQQLAEIELDPEE
jgi:pyruvate/2-oxoglutarate dehydrogenase complex dihydrolipoamide acyltransferase (E2) component